MTNLQTSFFVLKEFICKCMRIVLNDGKMFVNCFMVLHRIQAIRSLPSTPLTSLVNQLASDTQTHPHTQNAKCTVQGTNRFPPVTSKIHTNPFCDAVLTALILLCSVKPGTRVCSEHSSDSCWLREKKESAKRVCSEIQWCIVGKLL